MQGTVGLTLAGVGNGLDMRRALGKHERRILFMAGPLAGILAYAIAFFIAKRVSPLPYSIPSQIIALDLCHG